MFLIRTDTNGTSLDTPRNITRKSIPGHGSYFYCTNQQKYYLHLVNHSYSADDDHPLFNGIVHAIYTEK